MPQAASKNIPEARLGSVYIYIYIYTHTEREREREREIRIRVCMQLLQYNID